MLELIEPLRKKINENKEFQEQVRSSFKKQQSVIEKLAEKMSSENIKIWKPYLEIMIEQRLVEFVSFSFLFIHYIGCD